MDTVEANVFFFYMKFEDKFKVILIEILENYKSLFLTELLFGKNNDVKVFLMEIRGDFKRLLINKF